MSRRVCHDGNGTLQIRFRYDPDLVELVRMLPERRWHPDEKFWSVPDEHVVELVERLHPQGFSFDATTRGLYRQRGGRLALAPTPPALEPDFGATLPEAQQADRAPQAGDASDFTVSRLNEAARAALEEAFPFPVWLVGEIVGFNKSAHKRHVSFQLAERDSEGRSVAEVSAVLFERTRRELEAKLAAAGNPFRLEDELTVRVLSRVELYAPWGQYRVVIEDLDIYYTLGEAARRREEILRQLARDGLLELNRSLPFPELPLRVGLITSLQSDAYSDVLRTLQESGFAFRVTVHGARMQGRFTESSVLNALEWLREHHREFDVVLVCRGGGSRMDLSWLDSEVLGRAVATFPLPVVVGIGHEQDTSVLDAVGWRCKTPTAAAMLLVDRVRAAWERVSGRLQEIVRAGGQRLQDERRDAAERSRRLVRAGRQRLAEAARELQHRRSGVARTALARLRQARQSAQDRVRRIPLAALAAVRQRRAWLELAARRMLQGARRDLETQRGFLGHAASTLGPRARRCLARERERTEVRARRLSVADPRRIVERGYAILRRADGRLVRAGEDAPAGTALIAELRRGRLRARSEGAMEDAS